MYSTILALLAAPLLVATPALAQAQGSLVGAWMLVSATQTQNGQSQDYFGAHPLGQVIFGPEGQFSNILMRSGIAAFQANNRSTGTPEGNAAVVKGSIAYFGS